MEMQEFKKQIKVIFFEGIRVMRLPESQISFNLKELIATKYPGALVKFSLTDETGQRVRVEEEREIEKIIVGVAVRVKAETWMFHFDITKTFCYGEESKALRAEKKEEVAEVVSVKLLSVEEQTVETTTTTAKISSTAEPTVELIKVEEVETKTKTATLKKRPGRKSTSSNQKQKSLGQEETKS